MIDKLNAKTYVDKLYYRFQVLLLVRMLFDYNGICSIFISIHGWYARKDYIRSYDVANLERKLP